MFKKLFSVVLFIFTVGSLTTIYAQSVTLPYMGDGVNLDPSGTPSFLVNSDASVDVYFDMGALIVKAPTGGIKYLGVMDPATFGSINTFTNTTEGLQSDPLYDPCTGQVYTFKTTDDKAVKIRITAFTNGVSVVCDYVYDYMSGGSGEISGTISYSGAAGSGPGKAIVGLNEPSPGNPYWAPIKPVSITVPGAYSITSLAVNSTACYVLSYRDVNTNGAFDMGEPSGYSGPYTISGSPVAGANITVNDAAAPTLSHFSFTNIPTPQTMGYKFDLTITAMDASSSAITGYAGTPSVNSSLGVMIDGNLSAGVYSGKGIMQSSGTNTQISVYDASAGIISYSNSFDVDLDTNIIGLDHFTFSSVPSPQDAGTPFNITITAKDAFDSPLPSFNGDIFISISGGSTLTPKWVTLVNGVWSGQVTATEGTACMINADYCGRMGISNNFNVTTGGGGLSHFSFSSIASPQIAGVPFVVTLLAMDPSSNTVMINGNAGLTCSNGAIDPVSVPFNNANMWQGQLTLSAPGTGTTLTASMTGKEGTSNSFDVNAGGGTGNIEGTISYGGIQTGDVVVWITTGAATWNSGPIYSQTIVSFTPGSPYNIAVAANVPSFVYAFMDVNSNSTRDPGEPETMGWSPNQTVTAGSTVTYHPTLLMAGNEAVDHFSVDITVPGSKVTDVPFEITVSAKNISNITVNEYVGTVVLTCGGFTIVPSGPITLTDGYWTGNVTITGIGTTNSIQAYDSNLDKYGYSGTFDLNATGGDTGDIEGYLYYSGSTSGFPVRIGANVGIPSGPPSLIQTAFISPFTPGQYYSMPSVPVGSNVYLFAYIDKDSDNTLDADEPQTSNWVGPVNVVNSEVSMQNLTMVDPTPSYNISGAVYDYQMNPISGVTINLTGMQNRNITTAGDGTYIFNETPTGSYTITPQMTGKAFTPQFRNLSIISNSMINQNFTASDSGSGSVHHFRFSSIPTTQVSGSQFTVTIYAEDNTNAMVNYAGSANLLVSNGSIGPSVTSLFNNGIWVGPVTIIGEGTNVTITADIGTASGISNAFNVNAGGGGYTMSGRVVDSMNAGIQGVNISLSGTDSRNTVTDVSGNWSLTGLPAGNYNITPSKPEWMFNPSYISIPSFYSNMNINNIVGNAGGGTGGYMITGRIQRDGVGLGGVTLSLTGYRMFNINTAPDGMYSFMALPTGNYTITPTFAGYTFSPGSLSFSPLSSDQFEQNFAAIGGGGGTMGLSGSVDYIGTMYPAGDVTIMAGIGFPNASWQVRGTVSAANQGAFTLNVSQTDMNYYVFAFKDTNNNYKYDTGEPSSDPMGPFNVVSGSIFAIPDTIMVYDGSGGGETSYQGIEGNVFLSGLPLYGNLIVTASTGIGGEPAGYFQINVMNSMMHYRLDLGNFGDHYVTVHHDKNNNYMIDGDEASMLNEGPIWVTAGSYSFRDFTLQSGVAVGPSGTVNVNVNYSGDKVGTIHFDIQDQMPQPGVQPNMIKSAAIPMTMATRSFTISNVPVGSGYYMFAWLDADNSNSPTPSDPKTFNPIALATILDAGSIDVTASLQEESTTTVTGTNRVQGQVNYPESYGSYANVKIKIGYGSSYGVNTPIAQYFRNGSGYFEINNIPDAMGIYVEAFVDFNNNGYKEANEPSAVSGPYQLYNGLSIYVGTLEIQPQTQVEKSTVSVTVRGQLVKYNSNTMQDEPVGGAVIKMLDSGMFNNYNFESALTVSSVTTSSMLSSVLSSFGTTDYYNFEIPNVQVVGSENSWAYRLEASKTGFRKNFQDMNFQLNDNGQIVYLYNSINIEPKPVATVTNLVINPTTITPDNDGNNDRVNISFNYSIPAEGNMYVPGSTVKFVVDSDKDGLFEPMDYSIFMNINGKDFIKRNPSDWIDMMNPDYSKLIGPLTEEQSRQKRAEYDATMDVWVDGNSMMYNSGNNTYSRDIFMAWEGQDNSNNAVKNGTLNAKLMIADSFPFDQNDLTYSTTLQITIQTAGIIGTVVDALGTPIAGANINANSPGAWGQAFTNSSGTFEVSGLRANNTYRLEISKAGYIMVIKGDNNDGIKILTVGTPANAGTITLTKGTSVYGMITIPNPPLKGDMRDNMGNIMYDLWGNVEVMRTDGNGYYRDDIRVPLSGSVLSQTTVFYEMSLEPGQYSIKVRIPGYASKQEPFSIVSAPVGKNIILEKAPTVKGIIKLPAEIFASTSVTSSFISDVMRTGQYNLNINIQAESFDRKDHNGNGLQFMQYDMLQGRATAEFRLEGLLPRTSYYVYFESNGIFARKMVIVYSENAGLGTVQLDFGTKLTGTITMLNDISALLDNNYGNNSGQMGMGTIPEGIGINVGLRSLGDGTWIQNRVYISTNAGYPASANYSIRGLISGRYEIVVEAGSADVTPSLENRIVTVSTNVATNAAGFEIKMGMPTGTISGTINNISGITPDYTKVMVYVGYPASTSENSDIKMIPDANGKFSASNVPTGNAVVWVNEYSDFPSQTNMFGRASGNTGMMFKTLNTQSGTTNYINLDLLPASTLYIKVYGPPSALDDIVAKTTTYTNTNMFSNTFIKVQSLELRKFAQQLYDTGMLNKSDSPDGSGNVSMRDVSLSSFLVDRSSDANGQYLLYSKKGLSEGVYYVYPFVNLPVWAVLGYSTPTGNSSSYPIMRRVTYNYASVPFESYELLAKNSLKQVTFTLTSGVNISGSITRPQAGTAEYISVALKDYSTGKDISTYNVDFASANSVSLRTKSYNFDKVSPGKYLLLVWSQNYKVYSRDFAVPISTEPLVIPSITLSKGATLIGRLVDETGKSITSGVLVEANSYPPVEGSYRNTDQTGMSISTTGTTMGQFTFPNLPAGTYMIRISPKADSTVSYMITTKAGITVPDSQTDVDIGTIKVKGGTVIAGKVTNSSNEPLSNIPIVGYPQSVQDRQNNMINAVTDTNGIFVLRGINTGLQYWEVKVNIRPKDPTKQTATMLKYGVGVKSGIDVKTLSESLSFTLEEAQSAIKGTVKAYSALILPFKVEGIDVEDYPAALVLLQSPSDLASGDPMAGIKTITNVDGSFEIKGLVKGTYLLKVFAKGFGTFKQEVTVEESAINDIGDLNLTAGLSVGGNIRTQTGTRISQSEASIVVAATRDFTKIVFGNLSINPVTQEVERYDIYGVEAGVQYYVVLVEPNSNKVFVDPTVFTVTGSSETKDIVYTVYPPNFEAKSFKLTLPIGAFKQVGFTSINVPLGSSEDTIDITNLPNEIDLYYVYGYATEPLKEESIRQVVTTMTASGVFRPLSTSDEKFVNDRREFLFVYIPNGQEITDGYFQLKFTGTSSKGLIGETEYKFYLGEDGRSEKIINPMVGGNLTLGSGDESGIDVPAGSIDDDVALTSGTKASCVKVTDETIGATRRGKYSRGAFSTPITCFAAAKPGTQLSDIYELQVRLVSGPLATISQTTPISVKIAISTSALDLPESELKLYNYNETSKAWDAVSGTPSIDWSKFTLSMNVKHMSKFAVFHVVGGSGGGGSSDAAAADLSNAFVYPNPLKAGTLAADAPYQAAVITFKKLTSEARLKVYNIVGEMVYDDVKTDDASTDTLTWDTKTKSGEKVASGVYVYQLTNPKVSSDKKSGKLAIIR